MFKWYQCCTKPIVSHVLSECEYICALSYIQKKWKEICDGLQKIFITSESEIMKYFKDPKSKSQYLINPFSLNNTKFRINFKNEKFPIILELTQDYLVYIYDILKKLQKKDANPSRQRRKEGDAMAKSRDPSRLQASQYPGTKYSDPSQPLINKFFSVMKQSSNN